MQRSPVSSINSEKICFLSESFLHSEGEKPCRAWVRVINHPDKLNSRQKEIQNENSCDLDSVNAVVFYRNVLGVRATCHQMIFTKEGVPRGWLCGLANHAAYLESCLVLLWRCRLPTVLPFALRYAFSDAQSAVIFFASCRQVVGQFGVFSALSQFTEQGPLLPEPEWCSLQLHGRATSDTSSSSASQVSFTEFNLWWLVNQHVKKICGPAVALCNSWGLPTKVCTLVRRCFSIHLILLQFLAFLLEMETCRDIFKMTIFLMQTWM